ncbi:MAG: ATP-binding cassette domain-containing protein, partial [Limosilactobacillus sp.]
MGNITINNLTFAYPGQDSLFDHCQLNIDGSWKLGLLGRNGRGKTTLMKILLGQLKFQGQVQSNLPFTYFPQPISDPADLAWEALSNVNPRLEQWQVERELRLMEVDPALLWQPFATL